MLKKYICLECGHEVYKEEPPEPQYWNDEHICMFIDLEILRKHTDKILKLLKEDK